jgi:hypothetical protein
MKIFPKLTLVFFAVLLPCGVWVGAAPPRVTGNRPVVIEVPVPEGDALLPDSSRPDELDLLAFLFPDDPAETASTDDSELPTPSAVLNQARRQLLKHKSVSARIVETVAVFDKSFKAEGRYLQTALKTNDWHMRLEMDVKIGESSGSLLEVCDGSILWVRTAIDSGRKKSKDAKEKETTLARRNVSEIMAAARKAGDQKSETALIASFGLGGLPGLIAAIEQDMKFTTVKPERLSERSVFVVQGTWTEAFLQRAGRPGARAVSTLMLPTVPDAVRIYVDCETGFPHRITYLKKVPGRDVYRSMVNLDFLDVALDEPINAAEFAYKEPQGVPVAEQTKFFVDLFTPRDAKSQGGGPTGAPAGGSPR